MEKKCELMPSDKEGNCWVSEDALVCGTAKIHKNAKAHDKSREFGDAEVIGKAIAYRWSPQVYMYKNASINKYLRK